MSEGYENFVHLEFEVESDMDYVLELVADAAKESDTNGGIVVTKGRLISTYEY